MSEIDFLIPPIDVSTDISKLLDDLAQTAPCCSDGSGCSSGIAPPEDGDLDPA